MKRTNLWLILGVAALAILPLCIPRPRTEDQFSGADVRAKGVIAKVDPRYKPWIVPLFKPSGEVETFLFALQAALGAGVLCYYIGYMRGRREGSSMKEDDGHASS